MADEKIWMEIIRLKLDGVMTHVAMYEQFCKYDIQGLAAMHRYHAEEEFGCYLHMVGDYIKEFQKMPVLQQILPINIELNGATREEIMVKGTNAYEAWEKSVLEKLKGYFNSTQDEHIEKLIKDVTDELVCIRAIENDLDRGKSEELNIWATKKWKV